MHFLSRTGSLGAERWDQRYIESGRERMERGTEHPTIIDLDDPVPCCARILLIIAGVALVALLVAPFVIDPGTTRTTAESSSRQISTTRQRICRPTLNVPDLLEPVAGLAMPGWIRLCDWVIEPVIESPETFTGGH